MKNPRFEITPAEWASDCDKLLSVRRVVFVEEQNVPEEIEVDELDPVSFHILAIETGEEKPIGTARLLPDGHIGRVAVLKEWRNQGLGLALMKSLIEKARSENRRELMLHAQTQTVGFYEQLGFICIGEEFEEAGILHFRMRMALT